MQKAGNIWGSGEEEEVSTFFQVRRGESKRGRKGEREREGRRRFADVCTL